MKILHQSSNNQNTVAFGSKNRPIKSFQIPTSKDELSVTEMKATDCKAKKETHKLAKFYVDNFIDGSIDPSWKKYKDSANKAKYEKKINAIADFIEGVFSKDDGNSTVLVARDSKNKIRGSVMTYSFDEIKGLEDPKTFYLDSLAVDKSYRHNQIGTILANKSLETAKGIFTDAVLTGYNKAVPLYLKLGFKVSEINCPTKKAVFNKIVETRTDIPKYTQLMEMSLDEKATRWWKRAYKNLKRT